MMSFTLEREFRASPEELYKAWLDSEQHSEMTGGEAECSLREGAPFSAWDGYISGKNLLLEPPKKIVQSWRTTDFEDGDEDSRLELVITPTDHGCRLNLHHSNIPEGMPDFKRGWVEHYFEPMDEYFD